jgi:hypothetical protein
VASSSVAMESAASSSVLVSSSLVVTRFAVAESSAVPTLVAELEDAAMTATNETMPANPAALAMPTNCRAP